MKIHPSPQAHPVAPTAPTDTRSTDRAERSPDRAARVSLSDDARWIASVADEIRRAPEVRDEVVTSTRAALADGSFERNVDFDKLLDRLLADL